MFGLFKKKPKASAPPASPSGQPEAEADPGAAAVMQGPSEASLAWDNAIVEIQQEFALVLAKASSESQELIAAGSDFAQIDRLWTLADQDLHKAKDVVSRRWNRALRELPEMTEEQSDFEGNKRDIGSTDLDLLYQAAYREMRNSAASLVIPETAALWAGEWQAFPDYCTMIRLEQKIQQFRKTKDVPMELLHEFNDAAQRCWSTTYGVEAQHVPAMASHLERKIDSRMKYARKLLRNHWQWRAMEEGT